LKKRRRSQKMRKFRNTLKTTFSRLFGRDSAGALLLVATHIKRLRELLGANFNELDPRSDSKKYELDEIIWTVILMFFLREKSRNNMNTLRKSDFVLSAFKMLFKIRIPHLDTCNVVLEKIDPEKLKLILSIITSYFIQQKLFESTRYFGRVAVSFDGTGIGPVEADDSELQLKPGNDSNSPVELFEDPEPKKCSPMKKKGRIDVNVN